MIRGADFKGELPGIDSRLLPENNAERAVNCEFKYNTLRAFQGLEPVSANLTPLTPKSIYLYENQHWFSFSRDTFIVKSPVEQDEFRRIYFTNSEGAQVTSNLIALGTGVMPELAYSLGVPQPAAVIVNSVIDSGGDPDDFSDDETRFYTMTYVTEYGEEGAAAEASNSATLRSPNDTVDITLPNLTTNTSNVVAKRIYRTSGSTGEFFFVAEVPLSTTTFIDNVPGDQLGEVLATANFFPPPEFMTGLTLMANGIAAGYVGNQIAFSEPFQLHAYPPEYSRSTEYDIVGIAATRTSLVVGTEGNPYVFTGVSPDSMTEDRLPLQQACVSAQSMVAIGDIVIYASPDGLVGVSPGGARLITETILSKQAWAEFQPETIRAYHYEGKYIAFYGDVGGFVFDLRNNDFVRLDFYASAGYSDTRTDTLYLVVDGNLFAWDSANETLNYVWRSKRFEGSNRRELYLRVIADNLNLVNIKIWVDDRLILNQRGLPDSPIRIPPVRGRAWQYELSGKTQITDIVMTDNVQQL
ncbi:hypothetical protein [Agarilytica rhodophyticola]|uniref:hypothetical protein n=1 Tax=Agarilytica rhodophyticola TaxID=1737490 RepID=UPI000B3422C4|nr:hypothetical protein [Agarilytica rhodophyticola]